MDQLFIIIIIISVSIVEGKIVYSTYMMFEIKFRPINYALKQKKVL